MSELLLFAWFSFLPVTDPGVVVTQCRARLLPGWQPVVCRVLMGEVDWWAVAGSPGWDVQPGQALAICIESVNDAGQASACGEIESYTEDMLWWR